jgi:hypothetical protein
MGYENNRFSHAHQFAYRVEEIDCLLRSQHCRRLIKNEDIGSLVQEFQYFYSLLHSNTYIPHQILGDNLQPILFGNLLGNGYGSRLIDEAFSLWFKS